jgi:hypothetical protein
MMIVQMFEELGHGRQRDLRELRTSRKQALTYLPSRMARFKSSTLEPAYLP